MSLALLGDAPRFARTLHIVRPHLPPRHQLDSLLDTLYETRMLANNGPLSKALEEKLQQMLNVKHVVLVSSATTGLQMVFRALKLKGEVIMPSFTFIATAHSAEWEGLTPVFADIDSNHLTLDPASVKEAITDKTAAIVGMHTFGNACDIEALEKIAQENQLPLVFDSASALGGTYRGRPLGGFGIAEVFSLHATKIVNSFEGGFITTNNTDLYNELVLLRNFGFSGYDQVDSIGINGKIAEFPCGVALAALASLDRLSKKNQNVHQNYRQFLGSVPGLSFWDTRAECETNHHNLAVRIGKEFQLTRDELYKVLWAENILARRYYYPGCHRSEPYKARRSGPLPVTEQVCDEILLLPCFPDMTSEEVQSVSDVIVEAQSRTAEVRETLAVPVVR